MSNNSKLCLVGGLGLIIGGVVGAIGIATYIQTRMVLEWIEDDTIDINKMLDEEEKFIERLGLRNENDSI